MSNREKSDETFERGHIKTIVGLNDPEEALEYVKYEIFRRTEAWWKESDERRILLYAMSDRELLNLKQLLLEEIEKKNK